MHGRRRTLLAAILAAGAIFPGFVSATGFVQSNLFSLASGATLAEEQWVMADSIRLAGEARDDVFLLAPAAAGWPAKPEDGCIALAGVFHNDVWALGSRIVFSGIIEDHARFLARTIIVDGSIANASIFVGNTIQVNRSADLNGEAWLAGEDIIVAGWIAGKLTLIGKNVTLSGVFLDDVEVTAQDLVALPGAEIMGDLIYRGPAEFVADRRVVVHGNIRRLPIPEKAPEFSMATLVYQSWLFLGALLTAVIFLAVFPATAARALQRLKDSLWRCLTLGSLGLCLAPLGLAVAIVSLVGIPLGLLLAASLAVMVYLAKIPVALLLGCWLMRQAGPRSYAQQLLPLIIGLLFIYLGVGSGLTGLVVWVLVTAAGLGSLILALFPAAGVQRPPLSQPRSGPPPPPPDPPPAG